ncbi:hypothetical protein KR084_012239, partial [Drosophila pseudotakahashii]
ICTKKKDLQQDLHSGLAELRDVKEAVETLTAFLEQATRVETKIDEYFPIKSDEDLSKMDEKINDENCAQFITHMIMLLSEGRLSRSIRNIFSDEIILDYNLDGAISKKRLKSFENFFTALMSMFKYIVVFILLMVLLMFILVAIGQLESSEPVEKALTKAMRCVKNLHAAKKMALKSPKTMETSIKIK